MLVMIRSGVSKGSTLVVSLLMIGTIFASGIGFEDQKVISEEGIISYTEDTSNWSINPSSGPSDGGTNLTITGSGFSSLFDNATSGPIAHWNFDEIGPRYWVNSTIDHVGDVGGYTSLAVDSSGNIHISYYDQTNGDLKYAHYDGSTWTNSTVDSTGDVGFSTSLAVDSNGDVHISYYDITNYDLKYATYDGNSWTNSTVDSTGVVGHYTSIAIDSNDDLHISYLDSTNEDLKYATYDGSSWTVSTVDSTGSVGWYTSIAIDSNDNLHISYQDNDIYDLKYATYNGSSWTVSTVDSIGNMGWHTSIAIDSNDDLHISYFDNGNDDLKYATYDGSNWTTVTVDSTDDVGQDTSIAIDSWDNLHISYFDSTNTNLKYATYNGSNWTTSTAEYYGGTGGKGSSIAIDSNRDVHISYHSGWISPDDLKYAKFSGDLLLSDISGNGYDGTCLTTTCPTKLLGRLWTWGMSFDGVDDNVDLNFRFNSLPPTGFSTCMWVQNTRSTFSNTNVIWGTDGGDEWKIILPTDGSIQTYIRGTGGDATASMDNFSVRNYGGGWGWHHVCSIYDVNLGELQLYVDGTIGDTAYVNLTGFNQGVNQFLGCMGQVSSQTCRTDGYVNFLGKIDDVRIYDHALSSSAIQDYYFAETEPWGHYPLDEISGTNHVFDSSEGAFRVAGTVFGTPTEVPGKIDTALSFDGIGGDNDSISLSNSPIDEIIQNGAMTFSIWVNVETGITGDPYIASGGMGNSNLGSLIGLTIAPNGTVRFFTPSTTMTYPMIWSTTSIDDGTWHQVTATLEVTNNVVEIKLFIDGILESSLSGFQWDTLRTNSDYSSDFIIGAMNSNPFGTQQYFEGKLDDIWLFTHVLNNTEVLEHYEQVIKIGHWKLDEVSSPIFDSSSNDHDGIAHGTPTYGVPGMVGNAMNLDGDGDYLHLPIKMGYSSDDDFTICGYWNWNNFDSQFQTLFQNRFTNTPSDTAGIDLRLNYNYLRLRMTADDNSQSDNYLSNRTFMTNVWYHICLIADSTDYQISINGTIDHSLTVSKSTNKNWSYSGGYVDIGGFGTYYGGEYMDGQIDEIIIFNSALSSTQIQNVFNPNSNPMPSELTIQFEDYGNVTATIVNDTTITLVTPSGPSNGGVVNLTMWITDNYSIELPFDFTYTYDEPDRDFDGIIDSIDNCPDDWGNSTIGSIGCPDEDGDGYSNSDDEFPINPGEWSDGDGDGVGDNGDAFPQDGNETEDSDGDGVGDNGDAFPQDEDETEDSDNDGVGDNSDAFPLDENETVDSDGDGIGDNADEYPELNNFNDSDGDSFFDIEDAFPYDSSQWSDYDGDGHGDNPEGNDSDVFIHNITQWSDSDGDGFGDNWGNSSWNDTRLFVWPGKFVEGAVFADHCPTQFGNSSADGFYGCPDDDKDGIANMYDNSTVDENETILIDTDGDGVWDSEDLCPSTVADGFVGIDGCILDADGDGVDDLNDKCANTPQSIIVNVEGCEIVKEPEEKTETYMEQLLAGDEGTVFKTVGYGAIIIAVLGFMQTNFVAAMLPDAFRWVQVFRKKSNLNAEEEQELGYLQSLVQAYYYDTEIMHEELHQLKSDLTARYTNNELKKATREKMNTLIADIFEMDNSELKRIAHNDAYFGLAGTIDTKERSEMLSQDLAMRIDDTESFQDEGQEIYDMNIPKDSIKGEINQDDGYEYIEWPSNSGRWFIRNQRTEHWEEWRD